MVITKLLTICTVFPPIRWRIHQTLLAHTPSKGNRTVRWPEKGRTICVTYIKNHVILLISTLFGRFPFLRKLFADGGYQGPQFAQAIARIFPQLDVEIVKRSDVAGGFKVLPRRWVVERTFAWLNRCRRLCKDFENLTRKALAFLRLASIRLMLRKLCNP
jgi:transposase